MSNQQKTSGEQKTYRKVMIRVEAELWRAVRYYAAIKDVQTSSVVRRALKDFLDKHKIDAHKINEAEAALDSADDIEH
jgi:hypothetical protein